MAQIITLKQVSVLLNFSKEEVMELVRQKRIPYLYYPNRDEYFFPKEEVLANITPRPRDEKVKEEETPFGPEVGEGNETKEPVVARRGRPKK